MVHNIKKQFYLANADKKSYCNEYRHLIAHQGRNLFKAGDVLIQISPALQWVNIYIYNTVWIFYLWLEIS